MTETVFEPPIEMDLGNNPGKVTFKTLSSFHKWLEKENKFWADLDSKVPVRRLSQQLAGPFQRAVQQRKKITLGSRTAVAGIVKQDDIRDILSSYTQGRLVHSESGIAKQMADLADKESLEQLVYLYIAAVPEGLSVGLNHGGEIDLAPLLRASSQLEANRGTLGTVLTAKLDRIIEDGAAKYNEILLGAMDAGQVKIAADRALSNAEAALSTIENLSQDIERRIAEALAPQEARIETALKEANSSITKARDRFDAASSTTEESFGARMDVLEARADERLDGFIRSAEDRHDLKASKDFWEKKQGRHMKACKQFGGLFVGGIAVAIIVLTIFGADYLTRIGIFDDAHKLAIKEFNLPLALFATLPVIGTFWILRQVLKLYLTNLAQYSDADERIAMTKTFLMLEGEGKLSKEDRILIMQALFRSGPGSGDSDGGMPVGWFDILLKRLDSSKG